MSDQSGHDPRCMKKAAAARRNWILLLVAISIALVVFVAVDVRRRGRTEPLPPDQAALVDPADTRPFPFGRSTGAHKTDLTAYTAAARMFTDGRTAEEAYAARSPRGWRYQYPPLLAALLTPIARLETTTQSLLFGLFTAALVIALLVESRAWWRILGAPGDERAISLPGFIAMGAIAATALPALNTLQRGQVGLLVLWPLMIGFRLAWTSRSAAGSIGGGVALAFPAVLKFIPIMPVGIALLMAVGAALRRANRTVSASAAPRVRAVASFAGLVVGAIAFIGIVPGLLVGPQRTIEGTKIFVEGVVTNPAFSEEWDFEIHANRNQSLDSAAWKLVRSLRGEARVAADPLRLESAPAPESAIGTAPQETVPISESGTGTSSARPRALDFVSALIRALLALAALVTAIRLARESTRGAFAGFGIACLATLVVSPVSWGHHFTMLLPAMLAIPAWLEARGRATAAFAFSFSLGLAVVLHYSAIDSLGAIGLLGITGAVALVCTMVGTWQSLRTAPSQGAPPPRSAPTP